MSETTTPKDPTLDLSKSNLANLSNEELIERCQLLQLRANKFKYLAQAIAEKYLLEIGCEDMTVSFEQAFGGGL